MGPSLWKLVCKNDQEQRSVHREDFAGIGVCVIDYTSDTSLVDHVDGSRYEMMQRLISTCLRRVFGFIQMLESRMIIVVEKEITIWIRFCPVPYISIEA